MQKSYENPTVEIRLYSDLSQNITTSEPEVNKENDLNNDDNYNYLGKK